MPEKPDGMHGSLRGKGIFHAVHRCVNGFVLDDFNIHLCYLEFNCKSYTMGKFYTIHINSSPDLCISSNYTR